MDAQTLAIILFLLRIVALLLIGAAAIKQIKLIRTTTTEYPDVRMGVFIVTIILFVGQFIPILLDAVVATGNFYPGRNASPDLLASSYSLNNAIKDVFIGLLLVLFYFRPRKTLDRTK